MARTLLLPAVLSAVLAVGAPAAAQISAAGVAFPKSAAGRNCLAFDSVNSVYLLLESGSPLTARFVDRAGAPVGEAFLVSSEPVGFVGWYTVAFGGTPDDPVFLVTYIAADQASHPKYGRLVRYRAGAPQIGEPVKIADVGGEWYASERAQTVWAAGGFVVGSRVLPDGATYPQPQVQRFDLAGNVSAAHLLGDGLDYEGSPAIACAPSGVCLATGYANGVPFGNTFGTWARLFDATTLEPQGSLFYLDDHSARMEDQNALWLPGPGAFLTVWWRAAGYLDFRLVHPDGTLGPLDQSRSFGPGSGDIALAYNAATRTTLLVTKWSPPPANEGSDLYALELGDDGYPVRPENTLVLTAWDGHVPEYVPSLAADVGAAKWLATFMLAVGGRGALVSGTPVAGPDASVGGEDAAAPGVDGGAADAGSQGPDAGGAGGDAGSRPDDVARGSCGCAAAAAPSAWAAALAFLLARRRRA